MDRNKRTFGPKTTSLRLSGFLKCAFRCFRFRGGTVSCRLPVLVRVRICVMFSTIGLYGAGNSGGSSPPSRRVWCMCGMVAMNGDMAHGLDFDARSSWRVGSTYLGLELAFILQHPQCCRHAPHEFERRTEAPREIQRSIKDVAKDDVVCGVCLQEATWSMFRRHTREL